VTPLDERLGYLLKTGYGQLAERIDAALASLGLTARQLAVLSVVATNDSLSQIALSERLGVDRTTIVAMLDELEDAGLIERRRAPRDRRRNALALTVSGKSRVLRAEKARADAEADYLARLDSSDARRLVDLLQRLVLDPDPVNFT
jgi:DNA-binding MarR family transcriptional regulator